MGTKCNQDAYAYLTQACSIALEYLHQIDMVYVPRKRDKVVAAMKAKLKKAKQAKNLLMPELEECLAGCKFSSTEDSHNQARIGGAKVMYDFLSRKLEADT